MKRFMAVILAMLMVASFVTSGVLAGNGNGKDKTMLFVKGDDMQAPPPFGGHNIQLILSGVNYSFSPSGSKWVSATQVPELDIPTGGSLPAVIMDSTTTISYHVTLVNHSNGNNGDDENGTDNYDITSFVQIGPTTTTATPTGSETQPPSSSTPTGSETQPPSPSTPTGSETQPPSSSTPTGSETQPPSSSTPTGSETQPPSSSTPTGSETQPPSSSTPTGSETQPPTVTETPTTERTRPERTTTTATTTTETVVEITETQPPLTNAPTTVPVTTTLPVDIDDAETPLAGLPNTGAQNSHEAAIFFGALGILLGVGSAVLAVAAKKEEN